MRADGPSNYYEILEVPTHASEQDIIKAYNSALIAYSEDSVAIYSLMSSDDCKALREKVEEAYSILGNAEKRKAYDRLRGFNQTTPVMQDTTTNENKNKLPKFNFEEETVTLGQDSDFGRIQKPKSNQTVLNIKNNCAVDVDEARKKFALSYSNDEAMENKILNCTQFNGKILKEIREYKNVSLEKMAEMTRIMKTYLVYLENEEFNKLPATAYIRGFIFQYAKHLKLNADLVSNSYVQRVKEIRGELAKAL